MSRHIFVALAIGCVFATGCDLQPSRPGGTFDVGPVFASKIPAIKHTFTVKNTTGAPVRVVGEHHSCTCTDVTVDKVLLNPGATMPLTLSLKTPDAYSKVNVSCTLETDSKQFPDWVYALSYESFPTTSIRPDHIDLGSCDVRTSPEKGATFVVETFSLEGEEHPSLAKFNVPEELSITPEADPVVDSPAGGVRRTTHRMIARLNGRQADPGTFARPFDVAVTRGLGASAMVTWTVAKKINSEPSHISFGSMPIGAASVLRQSIVRSVDGRAFRITRIDSGSELVRVLSPLASELGKEVASQHVIAASLQSPSKFRSAMSGTIAITTQAEGGRQDELKIPWSVFFRRQENDQASILLP